MTGKEAAEVMIELAAAYPNVSLPKATTAVWRDWLRAMPYRDARRAVATVCAQEDFPTIHQVVAACGIAAEPVVAMLVAAKESWAGGAIGWEIVRDDRTKHGWRSSRDALQPPPESQGVPMPTDIREEIQQRIRHMADAKRVPAVPAGVARP